MIVGAGPDVSNERTGSSAGRDTLAGRGPAVPDVGTVLEPLGAATARPLNPKTTKDAETDKGFTSAKA
jgi:hypothetical protein